MGSKTLYTFSDRFDSQDIAVCQDCAAKMPATNGDTVVARSCDSEIECEMCPRPRVDGREFVRRFELIRFACFPRYNGRYNFNSKLFEREITALCEEFKISNAEYHKILVAGHPRPDVSVKMYNAERRRMGVW